MNDKTSGRKIAPDVTRVITASQWGNAPAADPVEDSRLGDLVDEFAARWQAGEITDPEEFLRQHAPYADALRRLLPAVQAMAQLGDAASRQGISPLGRGAVDPGDAEPRTLGDFRITREIGRGGMGVIYEATQLSLGRRVALKVLPFAATLDDRQLQRFKTEAQAAAHLHHSHIVPVFAVGCERGVHYYAMQFIEGEALSTVIAELRANRGERRGGQAGFVSETLQSSNRATFHRSVARLVAQAAEALAYAHRFGVIHRDIKPANLLVESPGHMWITDFGLARMESDANLTATGDIVGTLRYMSPEQALGRRAAIDHRTDIYSLGATLYELLTLEPVFGADTRRSILRQVAEDEPRPLRQIAPEVPAELETITLKALAKDPGDRFATAQDLADDLNRFLRDEPIRARRPGVRQRAVKWMRRHRAVVSTAAISLVVSLVAIAATVGWAVRDRDARVALERHEFQEAIEGVRVAVAAGDARTAAAELQRAERMAALGVGGLDELSEELQRLSTEVDLLRQFEAARLLRGEGGNLPIERGYLDYDRADEAYLAAFARLGIEPNKRFEGSAVEALRRRPIRATAAAALDDWTLVRMARGDGGSWREMLAAASLLDGDAQRAKVRAAVRDSDDAELLRIADSAMTFDLAPQTALLVAAALVERKQPKPAIALLRAVQPRHPGDFWVNYTLACYYLRWLYNENEALRFAGTAVSLRPDLPAPHLLLGHTLAELERPADGLAEAREALKLKSDYAAAHMIACRTLCELGRVREAVDAGREAVRLEPNTPAILRWVGKTMVRAGRHEEAIALYRTSLALDPRDEWTHCWLGHAYADQRQWPDAIREYEAAIAINATFAEPFDGLGRAYTFVGRLDEAEAARRRALQLFPYDDELYGRLGNLLSARGKWVEAAELVKNVFEIWFVAAKYHLRIGDYLVQRGDDDFAVNEYRLALRAQPDDREAGLRLAEALRRLGRRDEAVAAYRDALEPTGENARYYVELGMLLLSRGDLDDALAALSVAQRLAPEDLRARTCYARGLCLLGKPAEGAAILREVLAKDPGYALAVEFLAAAEAAGSGKGPGPSASPVR